MEQFEFILFTHI